MSTHPDPQTFEEFWPYYVSQHLDPTCRALHFAGTTLALACVAATPWVPPAILAAPVCGYGLAWVGHFVFEKNRPATFNSPKHAVWSLRGDFRMWRRILTGRMAAEVAQVQAEATLAEAA
ncbi:MAG: DUF962 domain-containing protein [Kofleriaceae bacterium]